MYCKSQSLQDPVQATSSMSGGTLKEHSSQNKGDDSNSSPVLPHKLKPLKLETRKHAAPYET
ncbi:uncharacterized protein isoform X3 [Leptinotarsa decemlineata]|uniref:uncharacterized protein isoform X3 n=1 Tax=Leptinotarsa decemlineata TaxID=7539 RepID=UPI003D30CB6D